MRAKVGLFSLVVFLGCGGTPARDPIAAPPATTPSASPSASSTAKAPAPTRPKRPVVVTLVVDQLAAWIVDERIDELPKEGGFARLVREGTRVREMRYAHACTDTAPGHAALYSGAPPRDTGIFNNETVDEATGRRVSVLLDPNAELVTADGPVKGSRASSAIKVKDQNLATILRAKVPDAAILAVSLKDRGAIFAGGTGPTASVWYDPPRGEWVTSTAFAGELPGWARARRSPIATAAESWTLANPEWVKAHAITPDAQNGEGDLGGMGITFPHPFQKAKDPKTAFRATPMANDALVDLALGALDDPGNQGKTTLLAISFSPNDYAGHTFGPDSWEAWDGLYRLDATLARFFAELDKRFGPEGWSTVLSADHGVGRMPEAFQGCAAGMSQDRWHRPCETGTRILPDPLAADLEKVAIATAGPGHWVSGVADPYVFFTKAAEALPDAKRKALDLALRKALLAKKGIKSVYIARDVVPLACPADTDESEAALVCRSISAGDPGELYMVASPGSFFDPSVVVGKGTSHGSPYLFDRTVPLFVRAPGRVKAGVLVDGPVPFGAYARNAAALLGIEPPSRARTAPDFTSEK